MKPCLILKILKAKRVLNGVLFVNYLYQPQNNKTWISLTILKTKFLILQNQ